MRKCMFMLFIWLGISLWVFPMQFRQETADAAASKDVYLTFDDGPSASYTGRVLDILKKNKIKATFFLVGDKVEVNTSIAQRIKDEGHAIRNHTYDHDYDKIYASAQAFLDAVNKWNTIVNKKIGVKSYIVRPPGGVQHLTDSMKKKLTDSGYKWISWNVVTGDGGYVPTKEKLIQNVKDCLNKYKITQTHAIVLMHDGIYEKDIKDPKKLDQIKQTRENLIKALPEIIKIFKDRGYTFKVITKDTKPAW